MRKIWLVVKREYITRVRTKAFILGTLALPILSIAFLLISILLSGGSSGNSVRIVIIDEAGGIGDAVESALMENKSAAQPKTQVAQVVEQPTPQLMAYFNSQIKNDEIEGILVLPKGLLNGTSAAEFYTRSMRAAALIGPLEQAVSTVIISRRLSAEGKKVGGMKNVFDLVRVQLVNPSLQKEEDPAETNFTIAIIAGMVLYMTLIVYGMSTMHSVMEEKSTRMIEILVSSVKPFDLLAGKILSVGAVALTQYLVWAVAVGVLFASAASVTAFVRPGATTPGISLSPSLLIYLVVFFLAGYFLYSALYAAAGAIVSNDEEARQAQMPLTLMILCSFMLFNVILNNPNSTLSVILSMTPFLSPILMTLRVAMQTPPLWQIILALAFSIATTIYTIRLSAKIYRVGILMYGKRPTLKELRRWLRYS
ncbi:MAG: ABC transporter permease [Acidobacteria bacterium]|nr:MAG: ABC transporter permease [Acidobacteriota bacterium]